MRDPEKVAWLSQTTLSVDETMATVDAIRQRFPQLLDPPSDDICYATQNRQLAIKEISSGADLVIVVGSANSSNSVRLAEVALEAGAKAAHRVDDATEIDEAWLEGVAVGQRHLRRLGARRPRRRRARVPHRARLPRRPGGAHRRGVADLRAAPGAAPRPAQGSARQTGREPEWPATSTSTRSTRSRGPIAQAVDLLRDDALIAYPTDSGYALGIQLGNRDGLDRIKKLRAARRQAPLHAGVPRLRPARASWCT